MYLLKNDLWIELYFVTGLKSDLYLNSNNFTVRKFEKRKWPFFLSVVLKPPKKKILIYDHRFYWRLVVKSVIGIQWNGLETWNSCKKYLPADFRSSTRGLELFWNGVWAWGVFERFGRSAKGGRLFCTRGRKGWSKIRPQRRKRRGTQRKTLGDSFSRDDNNLADFFF